MICVVLCEMSNTVVGARTCVSYLRANLVQKKKKKEGFCLSEERETLVIQVQIHNHHIEGQPAYGQRRDKKGVKRRGGTMRTRVEEKGEMRREARIYSLVFCHGMPGRTAHWYIVVGVCQHSIHLDCT